MGPLSWIPPGVLLKAYDPTDLMGTHGSRLGLATSSGRQVKESRSPKQKKTDHDQTTTALVEQYWQ